LASEVDICNLALANIGDTASVSSIKPPDGSVQAEQCARFYPIARNALLEMASWGFATTRVPLALADVNPSSTWLYAYKCPSDAINLLSVIPPDANDDYSEYFYPPQNCPYPQGAMPMQVAAMYAPQPYAQETALDGTMLILTNAENAVLRYTKLITDTSRFSPLFVTSLSWLLSSMLAGPLIKGDAGAMESKRCAAMFEAWEAKAEASDANQRRIQPEVVTPWIAGR
jgi:hypothetical protein